jgi:hypothetical protein
VNIDGSYGSLFMSVFVGSLLVFVLSFGITTLLDNKVLAVPIMVTLQKCGF